MGVIQSMWLVIAGDMHAKKCLQRMFGSKTININ